MRDASGEVLTLPSDERIAGPGAGIVMSIAREKRRCRTFSKCGPFGPGSPGSGSSRILELRGLVEHLLLGVPEGGLPDGFGEFARFVVAP